MKKIFSTIIIILFISNYSAQKLPIAQKPKLIKISQIKYKLACGDSEINFKKSDDWYNDKNISSIRAYDFKKSKSINTVKKLYNIKNDILFFKKKKIDSLRVFYRQSEEIDYILYFIKGKATGYVINVNNNPRPSMYSVSYDEEGNTNYNFIEHNVFLSKGNGILKNYYFSEWNCKNQKFSKETLKEEGEVRNNFKFGEWKYCSKEGKIDSTKIYTLKDLVDVRFPHCIFNKKEPCY